MRLPSDVAAIHSVQDGRLNHFGLICFDFRITISEDGSLRIVNVTKGDAGSYTCVATNHFGTASSTGNLAVKGTGVPVSAHSDASGGDGGTGRGEAAAPRQHVQMLPLAK